MLARDPGAAVLRLQPRFQALVERMGILEASAASRAAMRTHPPRHPDAVTGRALDTAL
jgi:hypothetical protein